MAEGDSLVRLAHRLRDLIVGRVIEHTDFRVPNAATVDLSGWCVHSVDSVAKYLLITVTPAHKHSGDAEPVVILSHLGMDGSWRMNAPLTHHVRCVLQIAGHRVTGENLQRLEVLTLQQADAALSFLGPDLLDPSWEHPAQAAKLLELAVLNLRNAPDQPIATALLDQRLLAGLGNIYRCELLALARMSPHQLISELTDQQLAGLVMLGRDLMVLNIPPRIGPSQRRATVDVRPDETALFGVRIATPQEQARGQADRRRGHASPLFWVYGRQRFGCLRCGNAIRVEPMRSESGPERTVHWCPVCQH